MSQPDFCAIQKSWTLKYCTECRQYWNTHKKGLSTAYLYTIRLTHIYIEQVSFLYSFYDNTIFQSKQFPFPFQSIDQNSLLWAPRYLESKLFLSTEGGGAVSSRSFDLLNSMIYDLKRSVDLRWLFDPVLHSSLDDLVSSFNHIHWFQCPMEHHTP